MLEYVYAYILLNYKFMKKQVKILHLEPSSGTILSSDYFSSKRDFFSSKHDFFLESRIKTSKFKWVWKTEERQNTCIIMTTAKR